MRKNIKKGDNIVFIVGCPRSGTTWVQNMLSEFSNVKTGAETELFNLYINRLYESWDKQIEKTSTHNRGKIGLPFYMKEDEFKKVVTKFLNKLMAKINPEDKLFIEKTPGHAFSVELIHKIYPRAKFIHIVRDGRDVVASLVSASKGWGSAWAPKSLKQASRLWVNHVQSADKQLQKLPKELWMLIRYEDLLRDTKDKLKEICIFVGIDFNMEKDEKIFNKYDFCKLRKSRIQGFSKNKEPEGFYRKGKAGSWRKEFNIVQKIRLNYYLKPLLKKFSYN